MYQKCELRNLPLWEIDLNSHISDMSVEPLHSGAPDSRLFILLFPSQARRRETKTDRFPWSVTV